MNKLLLALVLFVSQDTLRVSVSLVSIGVRVTDSRGRNVLGLKAADFSVRDNGIPQKIEFFSNEEQALAFGILLDRSSSMAFNAKLERAKEASQDLVRALRDGSEYFYISFDENVRVAGFLNERQKIESAIQQTTIGGGTALYDALVQAIALCKKARLPRQALVIISDGADQHSRYELQEVLNVVRESEVQIYAIGYYDPAEEAQYKTSDKRICCLIDGRKIDNPLLVLNELARESGGAAFFPKNDAELAKAVEEITSDIRAQYTLAFYPQSDDRGYHQLRVTVGGGRYKVRARPGYGKGEIPALSADRDDSRAFESKVDRRNGRMFYHDDFSDRSSGWPNRASTKYVKGGYQLSGNNVVATNGPVFRDFRASVTVKVTGNIGGGLIFRQAGENYFVLAAFPRRDIGPGSLRAFRVDAKGTVTLDRWSVITTKGTVKLEVRCQKDVCGIYQQESLLGDLKNVTPAEGRVGFCLIGSDVLFTDRGDALFTDLSVEEIR